MIELKEEVVVHTNGSITTYFKTTDHTLPKVWTSGYQYYFNKDVIDVIYKPAGKGSQS